jgi:drug/metabolite transporter, DME family
MSSPPTARILLVIAAILWSTGSLFMRLLQSESFLGSDAPELTPMQMAFYRSLFAGLSLCVMIRPSQCRIKPLMGVLIATFATMNALYVTAQSLGSAANAILLQNTGPVWVYFVGIWLLGEATDRRTLAAILIGLLGALVIVVGNWPWGEAGGSASKQALVLLMGLGSGITYGGVVLLLRQFRNESSVWLSILNLMGTALLLAAYQIGVHGWSHFVEWATTPTWQQIVFLAIYGCVQLAIPYVLFTWSLKSIHANEAGIITLLEPLLNPVWAYLVAPSRDTPTIWTALGGSLLLAAMVWRYAPRKIARPSEKSS